MTAGVGGAIAWTSLYYFWARLFNRTQVNSFLSWANLVLYEIGVVGATSITAAVGYVGGRFVLNGGSAIVASQAIASEIFPPLSSNPNSIFNDMPPVLVAFFTALTVLGALAGLLTMLIAKKQPVVVPPSAAVEMQKTSVS